MKIIKITSLWCTSCIIMNKIFDEYKQNKNYEILEYDYDFDSDKILEYNVGKILPVFIIFKDNKEVYRIIGEKNKKEFNNILNNIENGDL